MLVSLKAQKPLPLGGITGDGVHIWDADLSVIDEILTDDEFIDILWQSFRRVQPSARQTGRKRMALNRTLRTAALKHIKRWSFPDTFKELQRNLDYRAFTQFFDDKIPVASSLSRNLACIDAEAVRELNERLLQVAVERKVVKGRIYRQDTTVCETNVHYPTDSSLLQDGARVLERVVRQAEKLLPTLGQMRDRSKSVRNRVLEITRAARGKGEVARKRREKSYRALLRIVRPIVSGASQVAGKLGDGRVTRGLGWQEELVARSLKADLDTMRKRVEQVIRQTRARVCRGITDWPEKLLSVFVPRTCVIRKGKAHKPSEFGRLIDIVEVENGIVSDYRVCDGNPGDGTLLIPALKRHRERFGRAPHLAATDRGFWSARNEKEAHALGVKRVSIPTTGRLSQARLRIQRSRWFRQAQRWRAAGEGRIGTLKNVFGMDRCMYKDAQEREDDAMERWVGWCVFANNLVFMARALQRQERDGKQSGTTAGQGDRAAA
ncbi:MAG: ISNCY family transposase [Planctomycetota bacterium]|jgi:IS5 family transposase